MAPPPATPTPHRFLVPKRSQPKTETPKAFQSGGQQFQNTPRFSLHSTPRGPPGGGGGAGPSSSIPTPGPARSGAPSFIRPTPRATDPIHDVIDSSPPFVERAGGDESSGHRGDPIEVFDVDTDDDAVPESSPIGVESDINDYEHNYYREESSESEADMRHRSPKRRRISISSDFSSDTHASPQHHLDHDRDHDLPMHGADATQRPLLLDPSSSQPLSPVTINPRSPASAQQQPTFLKAPRFKPAEASPEELLHGRGGAADPLPDAFSPHRGKRGGKGAKYAPGGLAAEVRDWFVDAWAGASVAAEAAARRAGGDGGAGWGGNGEWVARIRVEEVREAPGMALVVGRSIGVEGGRGKGGDGDEDGGGGNGVERGDTRMRSVRMVLAGSPRITGLEKRQDVRPGVVVCVGRPTWEISLPEQGRWNVVCEWAILR
ncbi:uncharacterized protein F4807DRAFT_458548 [Annulohypoxylon truncatum]|uniref:uncharacterized protein n=1 Tax=Annulohypoxylon truncatum TaxID=327061 RepID=UPI002007819A|nr:uncharacterized protein F4807DRAFT_458548 [Annulohypoxylon truncatum]KAI1211653.1 hypothetical protein F4807DRAFT_458548 [Annulohypoxylon truncatum]